MGRPDVRKQSHIDTKMGNVRTMLIRLVKSLDSPEVTECAERRLAEMETGAADLHMRENSISGIAQLVGESQHLICQRLRLSDLPPDEGDTDESPEHLQKV